jgi:hypothetical protein
MLLLLLPLPDPHQPSEAAGGARRCNHQGHPAQEQVSDTAPSSIGSAGWSETGASHDIR